MAAFALSYYNLTRDNIRHIYSYRTREAFVPTPRSYERTTPKQFLPVPLIHRYPPRFYDYYPAFNVGLPRAPAFNHLSAAEVRQVVRRMRKPIACQPLETPTESKRSREREKVTKKEVKVVRFQSPVQDDAENVTEEERSNLKKDSSVVGGTDDAKATDKTEKKEVKDDSERKEVKGESKGKEVKSKSERKEVKGEAKGKSERKEVKGEAKGKSERKEDDNKGEEKENTGDPKSGKTVKGKTEKKKVKKKVEEKDASSEGKEVKDESPEKAVKDESKGDGTKDESKSEKLPELSNTKNNEKLKKTTSRQDRKSGVKLTFAKLSLPPIKH